MKSVSKKAIALAAGLAAALLLTACGAKRAGPDRPDEKKLLTEFHLNTKLLNGQIRLPDGSILAAAAPSLASGREDGAFVLTRDAADAPIVCDILGAYADGSVVNDPRSIVELSGEARRVRQMIRIEGSRVTRTTVEFPWNAAGMEDVLAIVEFDSFDQNASEKPKTKAIWPIVRGRKTNPVEVREEPSFDFEAAEARLCRICREAAAAYNDALLKLTPSPKP